MEMGDCEGIASELLDFVGFDDRPVDPWRLAEAMKVGVRYGAPGVRPHPEWRRGRWWIVLDPSQTRERQSSSLFHELGHLLNIAARLEHAGVPHRVRERMAWWTARALAWPRELFRKHWRQTGGNVEQLVEMHPWASHEFTASRLVMIEPFRMWVWDHTGPRTRRYWVGSRRVRWPRQPHRLEVEALEGARASKSFYEATGGISAWSIDDPPWGRVIGLTDAEVLAAW